MTAENTVRLIWDGFGMLVNDAGTWVAAGSMDFEMQFEEEVDVYVAEQVEPIRTETVTWTIPYPDNSDTDPYTETVRAYRALVETRPPCRCALCIGDLGGVGRVGEPEIATTRNFGNPYPKCQRCAHDFHGLPCETCGCSEPWKETK